MTDNMNAARVGELESLVGRLADEFLARRERGEQPEVEQYAARHPEAAELIRRALGSLRLVESVGNDPGPTDPASDSMISGLLGDFRIIREVGRGGMGVVYEAEQVSLRRRVALKVLPFAAVMDPRSMQRFKNEALAAAGLDHPNVVKVHAVGCDRGVHYIAMQFVDGRTLAELIAERQPAPTGAGAPSVSPGAAAPAAETQPVAKAPTERVRPDAGFYRRAAEWAAQAADALEHAHGLGVVHRDVKPANLMVDGRGHLWVTDFGLALVATDPALTASGDLIGTPRYMSPEQALGQRGIVDHRTDVYSLGVTMYELLTLEPAYAGEDRQELLREIAFEEPARPGQLNPAIPSDLETVVLKALEKSPADRYATARELANDLRRFLDDRPVQAQRTTGFQRLRKWARRHRPVVWAAGVSAGIILTLAVLALGVGTWLISAEQRQTKAAKDELERSYYFSLIALAEREWAANNMTRADQHLADCPEHMRGWEWFYLRNLRRGALPPFLHAGPVKCVAFSPDSRLLASGCIDGTVTLLDTSTWREVHLPPHDGHVGGLAFSRDGRHLATGGWDGKVNLFDAGTGQLLRTLSWPSCKAIHRVAFSPDGCYLAAGGGPHAIKIWDVNTGRVHCTLEAHGGQIRGLAFSPDGRRLASGGQDRAVTVWDVAVGVKSSPLPLGMTT
jgi:serine/threonine protein kinase